MSNYQGIEENSMLNGDGVRTVFWFSGCGHKCKGCHNPHTWNPKSGNPITDEVVDELLSTLRHDWVSGVTISGGDGLMPYNIDTTISICKRIREELPHSTIWIYSGDTYEAIIKDAKKLEVMTLCDVLVDGRFEIDKLDTSLCWRGSTNQRVINLKESLAQNQVILHCK